MAKSALSGVGRLLKPDELLTYDRKVLKFDPAVLRKAHAEVARRALDAPRTGR